MRQQLPTVLLRHVTRRGLHHDWLMAEPHTWHVPSAGLWAARVLPSHRHWADWGTWPLQRIANHRRTYLTYEGPLTRGRGYVSRVAEGYVVPLLWTSDRIVIDLAMQHCRGRVELHWRDTDRWQARLVPKRTLHGGGR